MTLLNELVFFCSAFLRIFEPSLPKVNELILFISFLFLLTGVFIFRKLWLGALSAILLIFLWKIRSSSEITVVFFELANAGIIWFELSLLLFGAYFFYHVLSDNRHFHPFTESIKSISSKMSVVLMLCWFMGGFMEGIAGFGIPALLMAPLMLASGFKPLSAVILPLASNTTSVLFGALGTPLKMGFNIHDVGIEVIYILILNALPVLIMPFLMAYLLSKTEKIQLAWKQEWKILFSAGLCFYIPFTLTGIFSIEFPSVAGGIIGLILFVFLVIPTHEKPPASLWWKTFYPYLFFILVLLGCRLLFQSYSFSILSHTKSISFYQPGLIFIIASGILLFHLVGKKAPTCFISLGKKSLHHIYFPALTVLLLVCFAQLVSDDLSKPVSSFMDFLSEPLQLAIIPFLGITGSFITGSATMSNLLFSVSLNSLPLASKSLMIALLNTGSSVGNCISLQNIVMVKSVVPRDITEARVIRLNGTVVIVYALLIILVALFIQHVNL